MRRWISAGVLVFAAVTGMAQEGYPLDGTWRGEHAGAGRTPVTIVLILQWDGQKITGTINPGPDAIPITDASLTPDGWKVALAARNKQGAPIRFEGAIADLGRYNRAIAGTWTEGGKHYPIRMVRE